MTLMQQYIHALYDEEDAFWDYIELLENETHKEHKALWVAIATDELQHFAKVKETIWGMSAEHSDMENAFCAELHEKYEQMKKCLEKHK